MKSILIINDNEKDIDDLLYILDRHFDILVSLDIEESIELIHEEPIDLCLLSLDIQKSEDIEAFKLLLQEKGIPTILTSCYPQKGASELQTLIKSFDGSELIKKIKRVVPMG